MPMPSSPEQQPKPWYQRWWAIALYAVIGAVLVACAMGDDDDDDDDDNDDGISEQFDGEADGDEADDAVDASGVFAVVTIVDGGPWKIIAL